MAGLLDGLLGGGGGGLLDFLRNNALNQQFPSGLASDQAQYGQPQYSPPMQAMAQSPVPQQPAPVIQAQPLQPPMQNGTPQAYAQSQMPPQQPPIQAQPAPQDIGGPGLGERLMNGFQGFANGGALLPAIAGGLAGFSGQGNLTEKALLAKGVDPAAVAASRNDPELRKALITQVYGPQTVQSLGEGYFADKNGKITRAYTPESKDSFSIVQKGEDAMGNKTYVKLNKATGEETPLAGASSEAPTGLGDISKSGQEYLATLPRAQAELVKGMIDGTLQPPSSFAMAKKSWQNLVAAAKTVDPTFDANNWAGRHKMTTDLASSGNSSMGGILSNGESSFKHLAEYAESAAEQGNASHNFPGGGQIAHAQNYLGNAMGGSDTLGKIKAINDNLGHYGQESTKFYAGTGGGVEERMNALKEMNPLTTSSEEAAAYAAKEKRLMLDRLDTKFQEIRNTFGEDQGNRIIAKHLPDIQSNIERIDAAVAKLKGDTVAPKTSPQPPRDAIEAEMRKRGLLK